jgi:hypothetical protein
MVTVHPPQERSRVTVSAVNPTPEIVKVAAPVLTAAILNVVPQRITAASNNKYWVLFCAAAR